MKVYNSIVSEKLLKYVPMPPERSLFNYAVNKCQIDQSLGVASYFCPAIVEIDDCLFIQEFYNDQTEEGYKTLYKQFDGDKKKIEMFVNSWSLEGFFLLSATDMVQVDEVIEEFGKTLKYFWDLRFRDLFPERQVIVELGMEIMGEIGLTITVYQEHEHE